MAKAKTGRRDLGRVVKALKGADIMALQEIELNWPRSDPGDMPDDQAAALGAVFPDYYWVYGPAFDVDASRRRDDGTIDNRRRQHGVMLLSRWPVLSQRIITLPKAPYPDFFNMRVGALECVVAFEPRPLTIYVLHLASLEDAERVDQIDHLLADISRAMNEGGAWSGPASYLSEDWACGEPAPPLPEDHILIGDFNSQPDSPPYRRLIEEGYSDALAQTNEDVAQLFTWGLGFETGGGSATYRLLLS